MSCGANAGAPNSNGPYTMLSEVRQCAPSFWGVQSDQRSRCFICSSNLRSSSSVPFHEWLGVRIHSDLLKQRRARPSFWHPRSAEQEVGRNVASVTPL
jgi:hypothetical protein